MFWGGLQETWYKWLTFVPSLPTVGTSVAQTVSPHVLERPAFREDLSPAVPWLQRAPGPRDSAVSCEHLQPLGTYPSCQGSSRCTVAPALPLPWDAADRSDCTAGRKQERGHGAPASLEAGPARCCVGAVSVCAGQGSEVQAGPGWRSCCRCSVCSETLLQVVILATCHPPGAQAGSGG